MLRWKRWAAAVLMTAILLASAAWAGAESWTLETADSLLTVTVTDGVPAVESLATKASGENRSEGVPVQLPERYFADGEWKNFGWQFSGAAESAEDGQQTLALRFEDAQAGADCTLCFRADPQLSGPFEVWSELENHSGERMQFRLAEIFSAGMRFEDPLTAWSIAKEGGQAEGITVKSGSYFEGSGIYTADMSETDEVKVWTTANQNWNSGGYIPITYLDCGGSCGAYVGLEWTYGQILVTREEQDGTAVTADVSLGYGRRDGTFDSRVDDGGTFVVPTVYLGVYDGDVDDASNGFKKWFFARKAPATLRDNPEEPYTQADMQIPPRSYPELGVESVKWDYGWWSDAQLFDWKSHEGSWVLRSPGYAGWVFKYHCKNMGDFGEWLLDKGMKNWTVYVLLHDTLDETGAPTDQCGEFNSVTHPDWFSSRRVALGMGKCADLGNEECVAWLQGAMKEFFETNNIGTWRSDFEPIATESDMDNRHFARGIDVQYWTATGFYEVVDYLLENIEGFRYENCCSGGALKDFATMRRATVINVEDTANYLSSRAAFSATSYALHPTQIQQPVNPDTFCPECETYYWPQIASDMENFGDVMKNYGMRSIILGAPMVASWSGSTGYTYLYDLNGYIGRYFNLYREKIRPIQREGELYHILPRPDGVHWDGVMYADPDSERELKGVAFLFKPSAEEGDTRTVCLRGLDAETRYQVRFEDHPECDAVYTGRQLTEEGIEVTIPGDVGSEILWIEEAA